MNPQVFTFINGRWRQNCHILANRTGEAVIIDPGSQPQHIKALVEKNHLHVLAILSTHGHYDHVGAVSALMDHYQIPFYLHGGDEQLLKRANLYRMVFGPSEPIPIPEITHDLSLMPRATEIGPYRITWISTPGHTEGSVCFLVDEMLFSGDTLMHGAVGRTDLPGGNPGELVASLRTLTALPSETLVYGGHRASTTIGAEFAPGARAWSLLQ